MFQKTLNLWDKNTIVLTRCDFFRDFWVRYFLFLWFGLYYLLSAFESEAVWFMSFSKEDFDLWTLLIGTIMLSWIPIQNWRIMPEFMTIFCRFRILERFARAWQLRDPNSLSAVLLRWFLLKISSFRILDTIVCLGHYFGCSSGLGRRWIFPEPFRAHWPCLFRRNNRD